MSREDQNYNQIPVIQAAHYQQEARVFLATDETQMSVLALALALALAIQNLFWGLCLPFAGMLADRFGARLVITAGALVYAAKCFVRWSRLHG